METSAKTEIRSILVKTKNQWNSFRLKDAKETWQKNTTYDPRLDIPEGESAIKDITGSPPKIGIINGRL